MADSIGEMVIQMSVETDKVTNSLRDMQGKAEKSAQGIENSISKIKADIDTKAAGMKISELQTWEKQLKSQFEDKIKLNADFKDIERAKTELDAVTGKLSIVKSTAETTNSPFPAWAAGAAGAAAGIFSITAAFGVLKESMNQAGNMEQYQASLKVMLGSTEQAKDRLQELVAFAASTPFTVPQVIALGNGLQAVGKYSKETMTNLGDLAAASGKPIEQVLGAFSKLASGQKGIAVDMFRDLLVTTNDWVDATGKGVSNSGEMLATTEEMLAALPKILAKKNFSGMMDEQSKTLKGQMSNLEDAAGQAANALGQTMLPLAKSIVSVAVPAVSTLKGNVELLVGVVSVAGTAFVGYELMVNGVTIAKKACSVATKLLKLDMESLNAAIASNPIGLLITGIAAAGVAVYELNQAYGPTIENQRKNIDANIAANKAEQQHTQSLISAKSKTQDVNAEYIKLYTQYKNAAIGSDEHKAAEQRLHGILSDQQKVYPGLIANTYDYEGGLNAMKTAAGNAVNDIRKLTGELNQQQKAMVNIQMAGANLDMSTTADKLRKDFAGVGGDNGMGAISKLLTHIQIGSKSMSEAMPELQRLQSQYAQWAAMGGKDQSYNYGVANDLTSFINAYQKKADLFKMAQSGQGIDATKGGNTGSQVRKEQIADLTTIAGLTKQIKELESKHSAQKIGTADFEATEAELASLRKQKKELMSAESGKTVKDKSESEKEKAQKEYYDSLKYMDSGYTDYQKEELNKRIKEMRKHGVDKIKLAQYEAEELKKIAEGQREWEKENQDKVFLKSGGKIFDNDINASLAANKYNKADSKGENKSGQKIINGYVGIDGQMSPIDNKGNEEQAKAGFNTALKDSEKLKDTWVQIGDSLANSGIEQFSGGIAKAVVEGQSLNEVFKNIGASLAEMAVQMVMMSALKSVFAGPLGFLGIGAHSGGEFVGTSSGVMKMAAGGSFTVPGGFPNDSFPLMVESGERVSVTPASQVNRQNSNNGADISALQSELVNVKNAIYAMNGNLINKNFAPNIVTNIDGKKVAHEAINPANSKLQRNGYKYNDF